MMLRLSLIIALIAGLAVAVLNFVFVREKIETVEAHRANEQKLKEDAQGQLAKTTRELEATTADLKQTKENLESAITEKDKAVAEAAAQVKRATDLSERLAKTTTERDEARQDLAAYRATGLSPDQILSLDKVIKQTQEALDVAMEEKKILARNLDTLQIKYNALTQEDYHGPPLPANLAGKVLVTDPKWDFVVLNIGEDHGAQAFGELLVSRNGKLVAKVRIQSVQKDRCIANIMPGWKLSETGVMEGDEVIPAYPAS